MHYFYGNIEALEHEAATGKGTHEERGEATTNPSGVYHAVLGSHALRGGGEWGSWVGGGWSWVGEGDGGSRGGWDGGRGGWEGGRGREEGKGWGGEQGEGEWGGGGGWLRDGEDYIITMNAHISPPLVGRICVDRHALLVNIFQYKRECLRSFV